MKTIRRSLIEAGVKNLQDFGYPNCNYDNIITDKIYSAFFASFLNNDKGYASSIDEEIDILLSQIAEQNKA